MPAYSMRELRADEVHLLDDFLYEAIFQRDESNLAPRGIINEPALRVYTEGFGQKPHDCCFCVEAEGKVVGAVWVRVISGFGHLDDVTPEFAVSLYKPYRGQGIGTALMRHMLAHLAQKGYVRASLAVQKDNYAVRMYEKLGFLRIGETNEEYIMAYNFA